MRYCVYGLGAIGGGIAARLAGAGVDLCGIARGRTLDRVRRDGLGFAPDRGAEPEFHRILVSDDPAELGPVDCVVVAVKSTSLPEIAEGIASLLGPGTVVVSAMNGVPWWFLPGLVGHRDDGPLDAVDRGGKLSALLPVDRTVGAVLHMNAATDAPGVVRHNSGSRIVLGAASGKELPAVDVVRDDLDRAGFDVTVSDLIQRDVWFKLWGNLSLNPITALTDASTDRVLDDPLLREFVVSCMTEARAVGDRLGLAIAQSPQERIAVTRRLGTVVPSMLQDARAGRALELDNLVGAVVELGERVAVPTPSVSALLGLARTFGRARGIYPSRP